MQVVVLEYFLEIDCATPDKLTDVKGIPGSRITKVFPVPLHVICILYFPFIGVSPASDGEYKKEKEE